jgi:hypothetical protein
LNFESIFQEHLESLLTMCLFYHRRVDKLESLYGITSESDILEILSIWPLMEILLSIENLIVLFRFGPIKPLEVKTERRKLISL